jgi:prophage regulatory protein
MPNLLTIHEVCEKLKVQKTTVYKWLRDDPTFPKQIKLGPRVVRWREKELTAWLESRVYG